MPTICELTPSDNIFLQVNETLGVLLSKYFIECVVVRGFYSLISKFFLCNLANRFCLHVVYVSV